MENCWFKLQQTHYPPPPEAKILAGCEGFENQGPICLGHIIEDLAHLDFVLNPQTIQPFTPGMKVAPSRMMDFKWDETTSKNAGDGGNIKGPAAVPGLTAGADTRTVFKQSVQSHEAYDRLDKYIVQPTQDYVARCLAQEPLAKHVAKSRSWTLYMITGLCVARKGNFTASEFRGKNVRGSAKVGVPEIASASTNANVGHKSARSTAGTHEGSFVFAIRLAKISKGWLRSQWSMSPMTKGTTFNNGAEEVDVAKVLSDEGFWAEVVEDRELGCAIAVRSDRK